MSSIKSTSSSIAVFDRESFIKGTGINAFGKIMQIRFHTLTTKSDILRFTVLVVRVEKAHRIVFNKYGTEIPPSTDDAYNYEQMFSALGSPLPSSLLDDKSLIQALHPHQNGHFEFWGHPDLSKSPFVKVGEEILVKTEGDSIFVKEVKRKEGNFDGMENEVLLTQMSNKSDHYTGGNLPGEDMEGVDDDEWDD